MSNKHWVAKVEEIIEKKRMIVKVKSMEFGLFYVNDQFYAWRNVCPHNGAPVCEGVICGTTMPSLVYEYEYGKHQQILRCPWHGWEFDLETGQHLVDEKVKLKGFDVSEVNGDLYIITK